MDHSDDTLNTEAAANVHYVDPRVRLLAEARWRLNTGGSRADWLMLGKENPEALIREGRDWIRAAVAAGIIPRPNDPISQTSSGPTPFGTGAVFAAGRPRHVPNRVNVPRCFAVSLVAGAVSFRNGARCFFVVALLVWRGAVIARYFSR